MSQAARALYRYLGTETGVSVFDAAYVEADKRGVPDTARWPALPDYMYWTKGEMRSVNDAGENGDTLRIGEAVLDWGTVQVYGQAYLTSIGVDTPEGAATAAANAIENSPITQGAGALLGAAPGDSETVGDMARWVKVGVVIVGIAAAAWALASVASIARTVKP